MAESGRLRIGELSKRVGESPELLRAWETRYGLVTPERTEGGLRLYSQTDERRIRVMQSHIAAGLSASEAARLAKLVLGADGDPGPGPSLMDVGLALEHNFSVLDEPGAQATLDHLFSSFRLDAALSEVILPFLHGLGQRWASAQVTVADEHFASNVIGGRLRGLARGWGHGVGPQAVLACPPGERHELGLLCFGLALRERGWRITYLGAETPPGEIASTVDGLTPAIVILAAVEPQRFLDIAEDVRTLAARVRVGIGGAGATDAMAEQLGAEALGSDVVKAAARLAPG
ncbi:MAG: MerR family transcriptional regulator [Solirubrobacteraceae bacterium]